MILKYRKKPVVIEAKQFDGTTVCYLDIMIWMGKIEIVLGDYDPTAVYIQTLEGEMRADIGDYIIKGIKGEFYPCKPDIFEQTYELANEE